MPAKQCAMAAMANNVDIGFVTLPRAYRQTIQGILGSAHRCQRQNKCHYRDPSKHAATSRDRLYSVQLEFAG